MPISHTKKIIFIHIPKNAGTSISHSKDLNFGSTNHMSWIQYAKIYPLEWKNYLKLSIVRNPWDRFVSCYEYARMLNSYWHSNDGNNSLDGPHPDHNIIKNLPFNDFAYKFFKGEFKLRHFGWLQQNFWICDNNQIVIDKWFKLEEIKNNDEFKNLFGEIKQINQSVRSKDSYREYFNQETIDLVAKFYKKDIELFNYCF